MQIFRQSPQATRNTAYDLRGPHHLVQACKNPFHLQRIGCCQQSISLIPRAYQFRVRSTHVTLRLSVHEARIRLTVLKTLQTNTIASGWASTNIFYVLFLCCSLLNDSRPLRASPLAEPISLHIISFLRPTSNMAPRLCERCSQIPFDPRLETLTSLT